MLRLTTRSLASAVSAALEKIGRPVPGHRTIARDESDRARSRS